MFSKKHKPFSIVAVCGAIVIVALLLGMLMLALPEIPSSDESAQPGCVRLESLSIHVNPIAQRKGVLL